MKEIDSKYTGTRFGRLVIIKVFKKFASYYAETVCDCGTKKIVYLGNITQGRTKSCGCLNIENICMPKPDRCLQKGEASFNALYRKYSYKARKRKLDFSLTRQQFRTLITKDCFYCNKQPSNILSRDTYNGDFIYNGIDRVNNTKGYTLENCVTCCFECNRAKGTLSYNQFIKLCQTITTNHLKRKKDESKS